MKKNVLILGLLFTFFFVVSALTSAHSPSTVVLDFNFATQTLSVTVNHGVSDINTHYIETLEIFVNDVLNHTENYSSQTSTSSLVDSFAILALDGDIIKVIATCNIAGSLTGQVTVQEQVVPEFNKSLIVIPISAVLIIGLVLVRRKFVK